MSYWEVIKFILKNSPTFVRVVVELKRLLYGWPEKKEMAKKVQEETEKRREEYRGALCRLGLRDCDD